VAKLDRRHRPKVLDDRCNPRQAFNLFIEPQGGPNVAGSGNVYLNDPTTDADGNFGLPRLNNQYSNINNRGSNGDSYYQSFNIQFQSTNLHRTGLNIVALLELWRRARPPARRKD